MATIDLTSNLPKTLYYLLYARYGNSSIASSDENQFKYKVFMTIFEYGAAWRIRLQLQEKLLNTKVDGTEASHGTIMYYNHAENPDTAPGTGDFQALDGISSQNTSNVKRGKLEGYAMIGSLIDTDHTQWFLDKFKKLFIKVVTPQKPLWYPEVNNNDTEDIYYVNSEPLFGNYITKTFQEVWADWESFKADYDSCGIPGTLDAITYAEDNEGV